MKFLMKFYFYQIKRIYLNVTYCILRKLHNHYNVYLISLPIISAKLDLIYISFTFSFHFYDTYKVVTRKGASFKMDQFHFESENKIS